MNNHHTAMRPPRTFRAATPRRLISTAICLLYSATAAFTQELDRVRYDGMLTSHAGINLTTNQSFTFRLYFEPTGGVPIWSETHTNVNVTAGRFSVTLASFQPLPAISATLALHLGVTVGRDSEMKPRLRFEPFGLSSCAVPRGLISIWSGSLSNVPPGWVVCDGTGGTPDLRDRFVLGAGSIAGVGDVGGRTRHDHSAVTIPGSVPTIRVDDNSGGTDFDIPDIRQQMAVVVAESTHMPPFYAILFIMKR